MTQPSSPVDPSRLNNLADGIFAVAMTFLAFTIQLPDPSQTHSDDSPGLVFQFVNLAIAFFVIGRYWVQHNRQYRLISLGNEALVMLDQLMLFGIVLIPVTLRIYNQIPLSFEGIALYASSFIFVGCVNVATLTYVLRHREFIKASGDVETIKFSMKLTFVPIAIFAASIAVALWSPQVAPMVWMLMALMPRLSRREKPVESRGPVEKQTLAETP